MKKIIITLVVMLGFVLIAASVPVQGYSSTSVMNQAYPGFEEETVDLAANELLNVLCDYKLTIVSQEDKKIRIACNPAPVLSTSTKTAVASTSTNSTTNTPVATTATRTATNGSTVTNTRTATSTRTSTAVANTPTNTIVPTNTSIPPTPTGTMTVTIPPITGKVIYVNPSGSDTNTGTSTAPYKTIQKALDVAVSGDRITLASGTYTQDLVTKSSGILIDGPRDAVVKGSSSTSGRAIQINHGNTTLLGFTIDGKLSNGYKDKLVFVQSLQARTALQNVRLIGLTIQNAGGECVRFRYYVQNAEFAFNNVRNCGQDDFPNGTWGGSGKNGEGLYIGTAPEQRSDGKNPDSSVDISNNNKVHHNYFNTMGNECVDIKEGAEQNIVELNTCTGQKDSESGGFDSRGNNNTFKNNTVFNNLGAGIRFGGDTADQGINNSVITNSIYGNANGGIKFQARPQSTVCGNRMNSNTGGNAVGTYGGQFNPTQPCTN